MTTQVSTWARPMAPTPMANPRTTHGGFAATIVSRVRAVLEADITERWRPAPTPAPATTRFGRCLQLVIHLLWVEYALPAQATPT